MDRAEFGFVTAFVKPCAREFEGRAVTPRQTGTSLLGKYR
jgi:hypothetical protein